ncbi:hypothetical protein MRB53_006042 [Persea americana]|uniref:Uncharacterized protein n=1 Tax=Persea americana TaxID=3435 RepID=A0ACC2MG14_PERAE|nr:hypothetical protein MRB53_006042 [Persea americana]
MARPKKPVAEDKERSQLDPSIEERKRLKSPALSRNLISNAPSKPISPLTPSNLILKHQGRDIGRMKLFGTIVYPKNKYLTLQFARGEKQVTCEDCFENMGSSLHNHRINKARLSFSLAHNDKSECGGAKLKGCCKDLVRDLKLIWYSSEINGKRLGCIDYRTGIIGSDIRPEASFGKKVLCSLAK